MCISAKGARCLCALFFFLKISLQWRPCLAPGLSINSGTVARVGLFFAFYYLKWWRAPSSGGPRSVFEHIRDIRRKAAQHDLLSDST
mmetsp:Transcript_50283/g.86111  ORF Transcript_50283/g.86111 Transcript_50283/m.86111 type:complete len:87 (+) Transcript_50283:113-373(+)